MRTTNGDLVEAALKSIANESKRQRQWMIGEDAFNIKAVHHQDIMKDEREVSGRFSIKRSPSISCWS